MLQITYGTKAGKQGGHTMSMTRRVLLFGAGAITFSLPLGCADYPESKAQRPVYSYENVEMGPRDTGYEYRKEAPQHPQVAPPQK